MKIALVHSFYKSAVPSGENFAVEMQSSALREAGHDVRVISLRTDDLRDDPLYEIRTALTVATGRGRSPLAQLRQFGPDVVHVHNLVPNFSTSWLSEWRGPIVATMHNFRPLCAKGFLFRDGQECTLCPRLGHHHAVIHRCYRDSRAATLPLALANRRGLSENPVVVRADRLLLLSGRARDTYESFGVAPDKMAVVPNFIEDRIPDASPPSALGSWLYAGRLSPEKGVLDLLKTFPENEQLTIAGSGPQAAEVQDLAERSPNVRFLGHIERDELLRLLPSAHGLVLPSLWAEGLPTIYLESLAAGLPVVCRQGNSAADDIRRWGPELVYSSKPELKEALSHARSVSSTWESRARAHYSENYTQQAWTRHVLEIYDQVIGHAAPRTKAAR
ncbi:glycosyltransferase family 4 protein [Kocuria sp. M4R2S49]|uniref:glycosyltransferase family 4 protein n=1 Tax=Kocuria rhizosphaericola TaxID=3376284 RepID=UPI0037B8AF8B